MTPRQARTERRAAERKAKKAEMKRNKQIALELDDRPLEEEFSAELMAEANAMRDRVHRRAGLTLSPHQVTPPDQNPDYEAGAPNGAVTTPVLVPQNTHIARECLDDVEEPSLQSMAERRSATNRANSQHSTGPRTATGKLASSRNSLKHGLASGEIIIRGENPCMFDALLTALLDEHQPGGLTQELLVNEMAQSYWLAQRALRLQNECFNQERVDDKRLSLYMRYHSTHQRAFHKALSTLMKIKKDQARGFVSQPRTAAVNRPPASPAAPPNLASFRSTILKFPSLTSSFGKMG